MTARPPAKKQAILENILSRIVTDGHYEAAFLSDSDGLPLAVVAPHETIDMMAAMTALLRDMASQLYRQLNLVDINELTVVGDDRFRLVCRFFQTDTGQSLSLTVIAPSDRSYRQITNQAIAKIKEAWAK